MKIIGIIPARYKSTRFPGKPLVLLLGKPMVIHVADIVSKALGRENTFIATDSEIIAEEVKKFGYHVVMTTEKALTGTDRVWEASQKIHADIYMNIQGDEPLLNPDDITLIANEKKKRMNCVINGMHAISYQEDPGNVNIPKVITTEDNQLVYMSRLPVPGFKSESCRPGTYMKQVCIYAFTHQELDRYGTCGRKSYLEHCDDIEILRFLDLKIPVYMVETRGFSLAIDVPDDVLVVENAMKRLNRT
jgi:3-deoxy-manno-octulosonate cytidylyltransferase (CMP-KDO synthetase)